MTTIDSWPFTCRYVCRSKGSIDRGFFELLSRVFIGPLGQWVGIWVDRRVDVESVGVSVDIGE